MRTSVLIIDDHVAFAETLSLALSLEEDLECVGFATTGADGLALATEHQPDVVLVDVVLPDGDGLDLLVDLRTSAPSSSVIILTGRTDARTLSDVVNARPDGYTPKSGPLRDVFALVRSAPTPGGAVAISHDTLAALTVAPDVAECDIASQLTGRELEVLNFLHEGRSVQQIAQTLHISVHTCRGHVKKILAKLGVHSQLEAIAEGRKLRLLS